MSLKITTSALAIGLISCGAIAAPIVVTNDTAPVPETWNEFRLIDVDPSYPNISFLLDTGTYGGGPFGSFAKPTVVEGGTYCFSLGPGLVSTEAANIGYRNPSAMAGTAVNAATSGWVYTEPLCDQQSVLPTVLTSGWYDIACQDCYTDRSVYANDGILYIPFRWKDTGTTQWSYGWVAFEVVPVFLQSCTLSCYPKTIDEMEMNFRWVAAGFETTPETDIIIGGGLCPADMNFDAELNFFDVSAYLELFGSGDLAADMNGDGDLNFFDVSEFLGYFNNDCGL